MKRQKLPVASSAPSQRLVSRIAADIWNNMVESPRHHVLELADYAHIFDAVGKAMRTSPESTPKRLMKTAGWHICDPSTPKIAQPKV